MRYLRDMNEKMLKLLPYKGFLRIINEIYLISSEYAVSSLPDLTRVYQFDIQVPKIGELKSLIPLPRLKAPKHRFNGEHYWEIGKAGYPLQKAMGEMRRVGFEIKKTYRVFEMPYHRFFVLTKGEEKN